ncbi:hypothetical protein GOV12_05990 [Candidatus Pacearchaeota archaeon]|nr:hypothetical protein [Candidatus Pacearchaeota archaeon]
MSKSEKEIAIFKVFNANAIYENGALTVNLYYPKNPPELNERMPEQLEFGIQTLENLLTQGFSSIATQTNPIRPADGGSMYVFTDGAFLVHRRDEGAPMHKLYHGAPGGYTDTLDSTFSENGLIQTGLRETAEENLLVLRDKPNTLIVPNDSREYTLKAANRLGLDLKPLYVDVETLPSNDTLNVFYEDGQHIFSSQGQGFLDLLWEGSTSLGLMQIRKIPFSSQEVLPIDAEGMPKGDKWLHFNRESYLIHPDEIKNKSFGTPLDNPRVFQTQIISGQPIITTPDYNPPFLGPDAIEVIHPHIWAPENHLTVCLDALEVPGYNRLRCELEKEKQKLEGKSLIPDEFLARKN